MEDFSPKAPIKTERKGKTAKYRQQVKQWLINDRHAPRKQRHTAKKVFDRLKEQAMKNNELFDVSDKAIRTLVSELRKELNVEEMAYIPLSHPAGEAQVDFGKTAFYEKGVYREGNHMAITFPHSDGKFVQLFKGENLECLMQGLKNVFEFIGKVPTVIRFDNMSTAVKNILSHGEREVTDGFKRLMCHYNFSSNFCNPNSGNEKGSVENFVGTRRRNLFVPVPQIDDLVQYNKELLEKCTEGMNREHLERMVVDLFQENLAVMKDLPAIEFDACKYVFAKTDKYGRAKFDTNWYSTASNLASQDVVLKITAMSVVVLDEKSRVLVERQRLYGKNKESIMWESYLTLIARRPRALKYTTFFDELPKDVGDFFAHSDIPETKKALQFLAERSDVDGYAKSIATFDKAVSMGASDSDSLTSIYRFLIDEKLPKASKGTTTSFPQEAEYKVDLEDYMSLIPERRKNG